MRLLKLAKTLILLFVLGSLMACTDKPIQPLLISQGVAAGEVNDHSAVIWSRSEHASVMHIDLFQHDLLVQQHSTFVSPEQDFIGKVLIEDLVANSEYVYQIWFDSTLKSPAHSASIKMRGTFKTAPEQKSNSAIRFVWTGDFAGQNVCRDAQQGFPILTRLVDEKADFFIGLGDMVYADGECLDTGRYGNQQIPGAFSSSVNLEDFRAHWRYNRADESFIKLLQSTAYFGVWDDHEVNNDFGPQVQIGDKVTDNLLLPLGLQAFLDFTPLLPDKDDPKRLYRTVRQGNNLQLFFLDTRQYREPNFRKDRHKSMLGEVQREWLIDSINQSDAQWKIIVSSVPLSIPTGGFGSSGRDGWANYDEGQSLSPDGVALSDTGFEQELIQILTAVQDNNLIFITTDVHFAQVFKYQPFPDNPDFVFHEVVVGPGNAGLFPNRQFDKSLNPQSLFFFGPESIQAVTTWEEAKRWFNYGIIDIAEQGDLTIQIKNTFGDSVFEKTILPIRPTE